MSSTETKEWQQRLQDAFTGQDGVIGERVQQLITGEALHRQEIISSVHGFTVLIDSFQDYALQTLDEAKTHGHTLNVYNFALNVAALRRFRAALNNFYSGYYFDGASHVRSVFEIVFYLGAVLNGYFRFDEMVAVASEIDHENMSSKQIRTASRKRQHEYERVVRSKMRGAESGLDEHEQTLIDEMLSIFHAHVHKAESNVVDFVLKMIKERTVPSTVPQFDLRNASIFCNTTVCAAWAFSRVLPYLSLPERYSKDWQHRQQVLDDSFRFYVEQWEQPIGPAFVRLIDLRFSFDHSVASNQVCKTEPYESESDHASTTPP